MIIKNQYVINPKPLIPEILKDKVKIFSTCCLTMDEVKTFNLALQTVADHLKKEKINLNNHQLVNIIFTENGEIVFYEDIETVTGIQMSVIAYMMNKIRKLDSLTILTIVYIEELVHFFWRIYDETEVKYKVVEIIRDIIPEFTIEDMKGMGFNGL